MVRKWSRAAAPAGGGAVTNSVQREGEEGGGKGAFGRPRCATVEIGRSVGIKGGGGKQCRKNDKDCGWKGFYRD